jgi:hypothetical protein
VQQLLEALAVLGQVDGVGLVPRIGMPASSSALGELQRRLAAELDDHAEQRAVLLLGSMISSTSSAVSGSK